MFGDGSPTRSFTYVRDLSKASSRYAVDQRGPINIGNPREMTIKEIARTIITMTGSKSRIVYGPLPRRPKQRHPDITLARTLLGWEPRSALETGLVGPSPTSNQSDVASDASEPPSLAIRHWVAMDIFR